MNLLLVHGNGGASSRFRLFLERLNREDNHQLHALVPELPGFEGRALPAGNIDWEVFLRPLQNAVAGRLQEDWFLYGHGIGGSILLEWAKKGYVQLNGEPWRPKGVLLHAPIGASLSHRWFPKVMKIKLLRQIIHWLIYQKWLQRFWEKKLFLQPESIPAELKARFFADYQSCRAFPHFFDLINEHWYRNIRKELKDEPFYFLWGEQERVVASKFIQYWKDDFPHSNFEVVPGWDHFPMLENPDAFYEKIIQLVHGRNAS